MKKILSLFLFVIAVTSCQAPKVKVTDKEPWREQMQGVAAEMYALFPLVADPSAFRDPSNYNQIEKSLTTLSSKSHEMSKQTSQKAEVDPVISAISGTFKREMTTALDSFRKENFEYARTTAYNTLQLCIQCHSRMSEASGSKMFFDSKAISGMKPLYQADWLAATRNFDEALRTYQLVIKDQSLTNAKPATWQQAVEKSLAISVRVKNDPELSLKIINIVLESKDVPSYYSRRADQWKTQVLRWKSEGSTKKTERLQKAQNLMGRYLEKGPDEVIATKASLINYLRASGLLHSHLHETNQPEELAKTYLLLGKCYETLNDPGEVGFSKNYYKSCIFSYPHSKVAVECFDAYEERVLLDAIQSNASVSTSILDYLEYLQSLAKPKK